MLTAAEIKGCLQPHEPDREGLAARAGGCARREAPAAPRGGEGGPTLEIYSYATTLDAPEAAANRCGYGHLAFEVDDVAMALDAVITAGGAARGNVVTRAVEGVGTLTFTYARDPEGNLLELQSWR